LGVALFCFGGAFVYGDQLARGWVGMVGIVFVLHFGLFHLLSCLWRSVGYDAPPIMNHPWAAISLSDFWGRRWNRAFRDLAHRFLFLPATRFVNPRLALLLGFLFSGLIHEAVITLPAGGGYGGPTAYFCLQGLGVAVEHSRFGKSLGLAHGWRGRLFAALVLFGPLVLLFPPVFIDNIVLPMMDAFGAA
jgi:Membrane bound O-acyl transferase family